MSRERWGTFAVNDHNRQRAFAAEVLLYDRLVIPYPTGDQRAIWEDEKWNPDLLDDYLGVLDNLAIRVPWDEQKRETFRARYQISQDVDFDARNLAEARERKQDPFYLTRILLMKDFLPELPKGVSKVWAIAAYPSASEFKKDYTDDILQKRRETLGMKISHKFFPG